MFKIGDRVEVNVTYPEKHIRGVQGEVVSTNLSDVWPVTVNLDVVDATVDESYRTALFSESELKAV